MTVINKLGYRKAEPREPEHIGFLGAVILTIAFCAVCYVLTILAFCIGGNPHGR